MKTYHLVIVSCLFFISMVLPAAVSAQPPHEPVAQKRPGSPNQTRTGFDVSQYVELDGLGFLSPERVQPWGHLFSDETERALLAQGDTVYVKFEKGHAIKPGDLYTVFSSFSDIDHPLTGRDLGYVISFLGRVVIKREVKPHLFKAEIVECYRPIQMGDPVLPFQPVSACIQISDPEPRTGDTSGAWMMAVAATKEMRQVIGQFSVLYMNHGHDHGIRRGNLFQIVSRGEPDQPEEPGLPDQVIGYVLVLEARPATSTGLVITSKKEFYPGAMLKAIDVEQELKKLLMHYGLEYSDADLENRPLHLLNRLAEEVGSPADLPDALLLLSKLPRCQTK